MKKALKITVFIFAEVLIFLIAFGIPGVFPGQCVAGIAGNNCGYFVVGLTMSNEKYDLLFYDPDCQLITAVSTSKRGGVREIGSYEQYFVVRTASLTEIYDHNGNVVNNVSYNGEVQSEYSFAWEDLAVEYERDKKGNEAIYYRNGDSSGTLDIDYEKYQGSYYSESVMVFAVLNFMLFGGYAFFRGTPHIEAAPHKE